MPEMRSLAEDATADIQSLMRGSDPSPAAQLTADERQQLAAVYNQLANRINDSRYVDARAPRGSRRTRATAWSTAAAAGVAGLIVAGALSHSAPPASATPALPRPLSFTSGSHAAAKRLLETAAARQALSPPVTGAVQFTRTQNYALSTTVRKWRSSTVVATAVRDVWRSSDGTALVREYRQDTEPAGGNVNGPKPAGDLDRGGRYGPWQWADPNHGFPTDVTTARAALLRSVVNATDFKPDIIIGDAVTEHLSTGTATPPQVAALYRVLAGLPTVFDAGPVTDRAGRRGHAVGVVVSGPGSIAVGTDYIVFGPGTGRTLQTEKVDSPNPPPGLHLPPGPLVEQYHLILAASPARRSGELPERP